MEEERTAGDAVFYMMDMSSSVELLNFILLPLMSVEPDLLMVWRIVLKKMRTDGAPYYI